MKRIALAGLRCWLSGFGLLVAAGGCGGDGITRHEVRGTVSYQGKAVQDGAMVFEPDASIGMVAPTCFVRIENGQYRTAPSESPTTGTYKVRVMGYDNSKMRTDVAPGEIVELPELFPEYELRVEIPPTDGKLDIEVPEKKDRQK
jgi:hypothetical protein